MSHDKQKTAETTIAKDDKTIRTIHKIRYYLAKYYPECELIKTYIALWNEYDAWRGGDPAKLRRRSQQLTRWRR
jgi:hypothetical protein